jgi:hypothetical protein
MTSGSPVRPLLVSLPVLLGLVMVGPVPVAGAATPATQSAITTGSLACSPVTTATLLTSAIIYGVSAPMDRLQVHAYTDHPTIEVTGTGFLPNESVQVYLDAAVPFSDPSQRSFPRRRPPTARGSAGRAAHHETPGGAEQRLCHQRRGQPGELRHAERDRHTTTVGVPMFPLLPVTLGSPPHVQDFIHRGPE